MIPNIKASADDFISTKFMTKMVHSGEMCARSKVSSQGIAPPGLHNMENGKATLNQKNLVKLNK